MHRDPTAAPLVEGVDYTVENGQWIFTREYHLHRGYCCRNGCRFCPYDDGGEIDSQPQQCNETCDNCGEAFRCRPGNCWCDAVNVSAKALTEMRCRFARCLCPQCLKHDCSGQE